VGAADPEAGAEAPPHVEIRRRGDVAVVVVTGDWTLPGVLPRLDDLLFTEPGGAEPRTLVFDASGLGAWDSRLLTFLYWGMIHCEAHTVAFRPGDLPEAIVRLLELARAVPEIESARETSRPSRLRALGVQGLLVWDGILAAVTFLGEVAAAVFDLARFRLRMRWRDFWVVVQANSSGALPIVTLISFLVGMIIAFLGAVVLRRFGAGYFVSYLVGYGMLREMAALMTGIIMAGRTGAAFAAELGSMKITEEIDAYRTLGISPVDHLVLPRILGLLVTMPLLTVYAGVVGILGGMIVAITVLDLSATQFMGGLLQAVTLSDGLLGIFKGTVFGLIIGLAGCMKGLQTGGDARAVGKAATSAVVLSITLIIAANAVIDWLAVLLNL
jgi:phospholipid/cholesterol/gamma-HCH transport system permease protein